MSKAKVMKNVSELSKLTPTQLIHIIIELHSKIERLEVENARLKKLPPSRR